MHGHKVLVCVCVRIHFWKTRMLSSQCISNQGSTILPWNDHQNRGQKTPITTGFWGVVFFISQHQQTHFSLCFCSFKRDFKNHHLFGLFLNLFFMIFPIIFPQFPTMISIDFPPFLGNSTTTSWLIFALFLAIHCLPFKAPPRGFKPKRSSGCVAVCRKCRMRRRPIHQPSMKISFKTWRDKLTQQLIYRMIFLSLSLYIYINRYVYNIYIYTHIYIYIFIICKFGYIYIYIYIYIHIFIYIYISWK